MNGNSSLSLEIICAITVITDSTLSKIDLRNADLRNANLNEANLRDARLDRAFLTGSQLFQCDLTSATLTGACIQDWNVNYETRLDDVICEYVYLKDEWLEQERRYLLSDRRPSDPNRIFAPGEFQAFVQKAVSTVDLIFTDGIDWQAFFQSFQELRSQYNDLSIQAIEKKSGGAFVIRLEVPAEADEGEIEHQAKELYEMKPQLQEQRYKAELQAKNGQILLYQEQLEFHRQNNTNLMGIVKTMAERETSNITNDLRGANIANFANQLQDNASQNASNFTQTINSNINNITKLITALRDAAQTFPDEQRDDAEMKIDDLQGDINDPEKRQPQRLQKRLIALFTLATAIAGIVTNSADFANNVLELSDKLNIPIPIELIQAHQAKQQSLPGK